MPPVPTCPTLPPLLHLRLFPDELAPLACSKGVGPQVRVSDVPGEFASAGVSALHRCSRVENGVRYRHLRSCVCTRGPQSSRLSRLQLVQYTAENAGHSATLSARCAACGGDQPPAPCHTDEETCFLCGNSHRADCPVRAQEVKILEGIEKCTRSEAMSVVKDRSLGYAAAVPPLWPVAPLLRTHLLFPC